MRALLRRLLITLAALAGLVLLLLAALAAVISTPAGSRWALNQAGAMAATASLEIGVGRQSGTLLRGLQLQDLSLRLGANRIAVQTLQVRWNPFSLLGGTLVLDELQIRGLQVAWTSLPSSTAAPAPSALLAASLPLPIALELDALGLEQASLDIDGTLLEIEQAALHASLRGTTLVLDALRLDTPALQVRGALRADLTGSIPLRGTLDWQLDTSSTGSAMAAGQLAVSGTLDTLSLSHSLVYPLQIESQGSLVLHLASGAGEPRLGLTHTLQAQSLSALLPAAGREVRIRQAEVRTTGWLDAMQISGLGALSLADASGAVLLDELALNWNALLQGSALLVDQLSLSTPTGNLGGSGELRWDDGLQASLNYVLRETDAGRYRALLPAGVLPGELASTGSLTLQQQADVLNGRLVVDSLQGTLNDYPLDGSGKIALDGDDIHVQQFSLRSGPNTLQLDGRWAETLDLQLRLQAPRLDTLSPLLAGSLEATAAIAGTPQDPRLTLQADGNALRLGSMTIASLRATAAHAEGSNRMTVDASALSNGRVTARSVILRGEGEAVSHRLQFSLDSASLQAQMALEGALSGRTADAPLQWAGTLTSATLDTELGEWRLGSPAALSWTAADWQLAEHCWQQSLSRACLQASGAADGTLQTTARLQGLPLERFNAAAAPAPARQLPALPQGITLQGLLDATVTIAGAAGAALSDLGVTAEMQWRDAVVTLATPPTSSDNETPLVVPRQLQLRTATLSAEQASGTWQLQSLLEFAQPRPDATAGLLGSARSRVNIAPSGALDGDVALEFEALQWVEALVPALRNVAGQVTGLAVIGGSLQAPQLSGSLNLQDGALQVPALGLALEAVKASLVADSSERLALQGEGRSGTGALQFFGTLEQPFSTSPTLRLQLDGDNFTLAERPELRMTVSPQLTVEASQRGVHIRGNLLLPLLDVRITSLPESAIDVSADTVLVTQPEDAPAVRNAASSSLGPLENVPMTAEVSVQLGEAAHFAGWGLDADVSGALEITQRASGALLTYGELTVRQGSYQTYGRTLNIEHGKLLFFGSYDNPALDIRATREADNVKVGVQMNGTLRNVSSQLFSTPTLPDGDIIAVMLTGRPLAEVGDQDSNALVGAITSLGINQGQTLTNQIRNQLGLDTLAISSTGDVANSSLTLGKYLTPRIFIQYGIGLFETESTLAVDYTVSERVKLEAKSGSTQSLDITYTVER